MAPKVTGHPNRWDMANWQKGKTTIAQSVGLGKYFKQYPSLTASLATQAAQAANSSGSGGSNPTLAANVSTGGKSGLKGLYNALLSAGASPSTAIGLIANAMNESSLNPEAKGDGGTSFGLWQFHEPDYPGASSLVTGNASADFIAQVKFLVSHGGLHAASGSTPEQAAGNFAANFERCVGCQPGGAQYNSRVGNVSGIISALGLGGKPL
jgi:hypothetical protein